MYWLNFNRVRLVVVGVVVVVVLSAGIVTADFVVSEPVFVEGPINSPGTDNMQGHSLLHNGLKMYYTANHGGTEGIWISERESMGSPWGEPVLVLEVWGDNPAISPNELELYFYQHTNDEYDTSMRSTRSSKNEDWGSPTEFNGLGWDAWGLDFSPDGLTVYFDSMRSFGQGGLDINIWMATRETVNSPWDEPVNLGENVNSPGDQTNASISNEGLVLFFESNDSVWMCTRASIGEDWGPAIDLDFDDTFPVLYGSRRTYYNPEISPDGLTLYLQSHRANSLNNKESFWQASINPVVDLNSDGIVDSEDTFVMVDHWGESNRLCDIGPTPLGDGIVDVWDMLVLAKYISPTPVAHWKLDETEGMFAADSVGNNDALVVGSTEWQPGSGQLDGALKLDGTSSCVITGLTVNPADSSFSIFAWVKVAIPGRSIISQQSMADWLATDAEGNLMTELKSSDQLAGPLFSNVIITDGQWHRIGLVWDGSRRILYVDGDAVAEDTLTGLESSQMGLYIGVDMNYTPGTFFDGMIDDVRIYSVALNAEQIEGLAQ